MPIPRRRRFALILLVITATAGCLALGWWQWSRWESTTGSFQNLGYALQWPFFAGFCVYAYRKFVRYEESPPPQVNQVSADLLPDRPPAAAPDHNRVLDEYNAYLAELAEKDTRTTP